MFRNIEMINLLIENGADINLKNNHNHTGLSFAIVRRHIEMINLLIESGADIDALVMNHTTILMYVINNKDIELVQLLFFYEKNNNLIRFFVKKSCTIINRKRC